MCWYLGNRNYFPFTINSQCIAQGMTQSRDLMNEMNEWPLGVFKKMFKKFF